MLTCIQKRGEEMSFSSLSLLDRYHNLTALCGILVPQPGIEPTPPAVEPQSLNHCTAGEVPSFLYFGLIFWKTEKVAHGVRGKQLIECLFSKQVRTLVSDSVRANDQIRSHQSLSRVRLFVTPWITARQASLSLTNSRSSLRLTSIKPVMPSSHLILCHPLLLLPPIPSLLRNQEQLFWLASLSYSVWQRSLKEK